MNMSRRNLFATACAAVLMSLPVLRGAPAKSGDTFPDLAAAGLEGTVPDLAGKVVIIDFWASWCGPCKKAMPLLAELQKQYGEKGVVVVGVSVDEVRSDMEAYLKKNPMPFAILRDPKGKLAEQLSMQGVPTSYVVGQDGKIRAVHRGFDGEKTRAKYLVQLDELLKSK